MRLIDAFRCGLLFGAMATFGCAFDKSNPLAGGAASPAPGALVPPDAGRVVMPSGPADDPARPPTTPVADAGAPAPTPDGPPTAVPPPGTPCWDRPYDFERPERLDDLSSPEDDAEPTLSPDGLRLVFASTRSGNWDLWLAERATADGPWSAPRVLAGYATGATERAPTIAPDGAHIYFVSDRVEGGVQAVDVWVAPFPTGNPTRSLLSTPKNDERVLVASDDRGALVAAEKKLYASARSDASLPWPTPVAQVAMPGCSECSPSALSPDGKTLVVSRKVSTGGGPGPGGANEDHRDLAILTRADATSAFGALRAIGGVNDPAADDQDGTLSADGCWLYFSSDRAGNDDLYRARRR